MVGSSRVVAGRPSQAVPPGTPAWVDLWTPDVGRSQDFYAGLFGWQFRPVPGAEATGYTVALLDGQPVAGLYESPEPPIPWTLYLASSDPARTADLAETLEGQPVAPELHIPGVGDKRVMIDLNGAAFGICRPGADWRFDVGLAGTLLWAELITNRGKMADHFFAQLFGYQHRQFGDGGYFDYVVWYVGAESMLARIRISEYAFDKRARWLIYFGAEPTVGVDATAERAVELGGSVRLEPFDASFGRVAVLTDTTGARFAVVDPTRASDDMGAAVDDPYSD